MSENREKIKQEDINKLGALDFHFQVPNFDNPLMLISYIIVEVSKFASAMQEFNKEKIIKPDT